jgi:Spy/CpxP family protein refolding chaperone
MNRTAWTVSVFGILALLVGVAVGGAAAEGNGGPPVAKTGEGPPPPTPGVIGKFILAHAQELNLTEDQKQKIEAWLKEHQGEGPGKPGGGAGTPGDGAGKPGAGVGKAGDAKHGKGPFADILTDEQHAKLRELLKAEGPQGGHPPAGEGKKPPR